MKSEERLEAERGKPFKIWRKSVPGRKSSVTSLKERCVSFNGVVGPASGDSDRR